MMIETLNYGVHFKNAPSTQYMVTMEVLQLKLLAHDIVDMIQTPLNLATEIIADAIPIDEQFLNSLMSTFNIMYVLRRDNEVRGFLRNNIFLGPIVAEAYGKLQNHFPYSTIYMDVIGDELVISVSTTLSPKDAKDALYGFDEAWWLDNCINAQSKLCITVEFQ